MSAFFASRIRPTALPGIAPPQSSFPEGSPQEMGPPDKMRAEARNEPDSHHEPAPARA